MVITGGENVYPAEVEGVLYEHPGVADVAVIGIADERWGEAVVAVVAPREGAIVTLDDLRSFAGERLARYKLPTRVEVVDILPRNPAGKVLKFELRERFVRHEATASRHRVAGPLHVSRDLGALASSATRCPVPVGRSKVHALSSSVRAFSMSSAAPRSASI